jgi:hypothetical protein
MSTGLSKRRRGRLCGEQIAVMVLNGAYGGEPALRKSDPELLLEISDGK